MLLKWLHSKVTFIKSLLYLLTLFQGFSSKSQKATSNANQIATEAISNIRTIASFTSEDRVAAMFIEKLREPYRVGLRGATLGGFLTGVGQIFMFGTQALTMWYGGTLIEDGSYSFVDVMTVVMAIFMAAMSLGESSAYTPDAGKAKSAAREIFKVIDRVPLIDAYSDQGIQGQEVKGKIDLKRK
jgi:ATP-binding cassette subfamily B (MDR/TAP) protein 1